MLPDGIANHGHWVALAIRLRQPSSQEASQQIAAAPLRQIWIARTVYKNLAAGSSHECLMAFEDDETIAQAPRNLPQGPDSIRLHTRG
jgi:hypothetical protein